MKILKSRYTKCDGKDVVWFTEDKRSQNNRRVRIAAIIAVLFSGNAFSADTVGSCASSDIYDVWSNSSYADGNWVLLANKPGVRDCLNSILPIQEAVNKQVKNLRVTGDNSVALGKDSVVGRPNTVSVGAVGTERTVSNVAPGSLGTDAVNINQLNNVKQGIDENRKMIVSNRDSVNELQGKINSGSIGITKVNSKNKSISIGGDNGGNEVSVSGKDGARIVSGVADGINGNDAVNINQLNNVKQGVDENRKMIVSNRDGVNELQGKINSGSIGITKVNSKNKSISIGGDNGGNEVSVSGKNGARIISGVADGINGNDAVNVGQLDLVKNKVNDNAGKIKQLNNKVQGIENKVNRGLASAAALNGLFQPYGVGNYNFTAAVGGYNSETALAVGTGYRVNENIALKGGVAVANGDGSVMYNVGVNLEW